MTALQIRIVVRPNFIGNYYENFLISPIFDRIFLT